MKSRIFELVKIFLQDSAYTFPSYCITLLCVCYTHVKSRGSFSSRLFHAPLPLSLSPLSTAVAVGTFLEKKRSVKIARILRFFSFLKNCDFHYRKSTAYQTPTIIYQNVNSHRNVFLFTMKIIRILKNKKREKHFLRFKDASQGDQQWHLNEVRANFTATFYRTSNESKAFEARSNFSSRPRSGKKHPLSWRRLNFTRNSSYCGRYRMSNFHGANIGDIYMELKRKGREEMGEEWEIGAQRIVSWPRFLRMGKIVFQGKRANSW